MFEQSILESSPRWKTRRGWTTLASSSLQLLLLTLLVLVPVLHPDALPLRLRAVMTGLPRPYQPASPREGTPRSGSGSRTVAMPNVFVEPDHIPTETYTGPDRGPGPMGPDVAEPPAEHGCPTCPTGIPPGMSPVFNPPPVVPRPAPRSVVVSGGVIEGYLVQQVQPIYPHIAHTAGIQGDVILQAVIGRDGTIEQLHAVSGHPWLIPPALDAVRQWRYRPYRLNGQPVEVETQITVRFILSGR